MIQPDQQDVGIGGLAAALAKAQAAFPPIKRDKEVDTRTYKYKYADLSQIIDAVRGPLAANGLAITQLLDGPDLLTMLLHESGATLSGRMPLPHNGETIQQLGSAITYLRRYALQAMLGIAAEEDDDGEAAGKVRARTAAENLTGRREQPTAPPAFNPSAAQDPGGLIGTAEIGTADADFQLRQVTTEDRPEPHPRIAFRLVEGRSKLKVEALDALADQIAEYRAGIEGFRVTCWGHLRPETWTPKGTNKPQTYQILTLSRLKVGQLELTEPEPLDAEELHPAAEWNIAGADRPAVPA